MLAHTAVSQEESHPMTDQGKYGYPYCPICDEQLENAKLSMLQSEKTVRCEHCGTKVTVARGLLKPKIKAWEAPEELQSELQQGEGIFCTKCGQKLSKGNNYCNNCGNRSAG